MKLNIPQLYETFEQDAVIKSRVKKGELIGSFLFKWDTIQLQCASKKVSTTNVEL